MSDFERMPRGSTCEVHLLTRSNYHMFPAHYGYCSSRAQWWCFGLYALCNAHKAVVERLGITRERIS
jgi:hypothetical protein